MVRSTIEDEDDALTPAILVLLGQLLGKLAQEQYNDLIVSHTLSKTQPHFPSRRDSNY